MAIKPTRAWMDSEGVFHQTREAACKAEYRRLLLATFLSPMTVTDARHQPELGIKLEVLVEGMFDIDRIFGEATKEDTRVEFAPGVPEADA